MKKLSATKGPDGSSLLDGSLAVLTSEMGDGNNHERGDVPVFLVGLAGGRLAPQNGKLLATDANIPLGNVWLTITRKLGVDADAVGQSNGTVNGL